MHIMAKEKVLLSVVITASLVLFMCAGVAAQSPKPAKITGTYTNMYFNREGGDLLGEELKIVRTRKGYQGALQVAEGGPGELIVVDIKLTGNKIEFAVPDTHPDACQFSGTLNVGVIRGEFQYKTGSTEKVTLKKGKSYWD